MEVVFDRIEKRYGDVYAVKDFSLKIESGALHFLLGPSGCGKTTSLRMLAGLEKPTGGRILFDGKDVTNLPAAERGIGMVFQNYALWPHMSVRENIEYGLKLRKISAAELKKRMDEVLDLTKLVPFVDRYPGQLSGGQQQRVALARALAIRPNVLLLDEPLSNLDAKLRLEMRENISRIHRQTGTTTVYVTHDQKESLSMGSMISVMHAGLLIQTDSPRDMYRRPKNPFIAGFIGETNLIDGTYAGREGEQHVVETRYGKIYAQGAAGTFTNNSPVVLSIRPEAIKINLGSKDGHLNHIDMTIDHITYLGESEQWHLLTPTTHQHVTATLFHPPEHTKKSGEHVLCTLPVEDVYVLPKLDMGRGT